MLASIFSLNVIQTALELGCIYALVALALFLSYSILNIADLSTGRLLHPWLRCRLSGGADRPPLPRPAGGDGGRCMLRFHHSFFADPPRVESIMAGIIVNTGLYTINWP